MNEKYYITISRQFGSGGRDIAVKLGQLLNIPVYDREIITMTAEKGDMAKDFVEEHEEKNINSILYTLAMGSNIFLSHGSNAFHMPINDHLFVIQNEVIHKLAEEGSSIFVGRSSDYVLRNEKNRISIFVYANSEDRIQRVMTRHNVSRQEALQLITKTDKHRSSYYNYYTGLKWGKTDQYDLCINSSLLGVEKTAEHLAEFVKSWLKDINQ